MRSTPGRGIRWQSTDGSSIVAAPTPPRPISERQVVQAVSSRQLYWHAWDPSRLPLPPSAPERRARGVVGIDQRAGLTVRFLYPPETTPLEALYGIEETEGGLPPALAGAVLAAATARRLGTAAPAVIADFCTPRSQELPSRLNRRQIDALVEEWLEGLPDSALETTVPPGSVNQARFWLAAARRLWEPEVRKHLARLELSGDAAVATSALATTHLSLRGWDRISVGSAKLAIESERALIGAWFHALEWERGEVTAEALHFLMRRQVPQGAPTIDRGQLPPGISEPPDAELARGLTSALVQEAVEQAAYAPSGGFVLDLPQGYPLHAWGVSQLRVWARPDRLWVAALDEAGNVSVSFVWFPGEPLSRLVASAPAAPLTEVTLAALWRDLQVGGEKTVPSKGEAKARDKRKSSRRRRRPRRADSPAAPGEAVVRILPGRPVRVRGKRTWGRREEHEAIRRRAHGVRGHLRRLQPGARASAEAREIAGAFGVIVPHGYTFVRPHVRGEGEGQAPAEVVVRARGLATVMALLG